MKKILALALSLMVAGLTVTGCGGEKKSCRHKVYS
jgi:hypothetical protein